MTAPRFDAIARRFAQRRDARRHATAEGTPTSLPPVDPPEKIPYLFVQSFRGGSIAPKEGAEGTWTVLLSHELGQTVYFSDRPDRIVGAAPTQQFLDSLGFSADNPPNAALVIDDGKGGTDIALVELMNPAWHEESATIVYDMSVLENFEAEVDMQVEGVTADLASVASSFGSAHLFIDDCMDQHVYCIGPTLTDDQGYIVPRWQDQGLQSMCWNWSTWLCEPCNGAVLLQACWDRQVCVEGYPCYIQPRLTPPA